RITYVGGLGNDVVLTFVDTPPSKLGLTPSPASINEGDTVTLTGSFTDPDPGQSHTLIFNWGDGQSTSVTLPAISGLSVGNRFIGGDNRSEEHTSELQSP